MSTSKTIQKQVAESKSKLQKAGFSLAALEGLTEQEIITLADRQNLSYKEEAKSTSQSKGVQFRFLNHISELEGQRMIFDDAVNWLCADMAPDSKWFNADWDTVVTERQASQLAEMLGKQATFNEALYQKMRTRAKARINSHIVHDSEKNTTSNNTVNKYLAKTDADVRCKLEEKAGVKVAIYLAKI